LTSALDGVSGQRYARPRFTPRERIPGTHWTGGWVGLRAGLEVLATGAAELTGRIYWHTSGMSAQGDPCTDTIFWYTVRPHLLYSASSTVPLTKYNILHPITVAWFHKNVYLSDEIWITLKPSPLFLSVHSSSPPWGLHGDIGTALLCYFMFVPHCLPPTNQRIKTEAFYCTCHFTGVELDKGRAQVETVWEQGLGENIWTQQRGSDRRLKKPA
jgi:hypothetical protein